MMPLRRYRRAWIAILAAGCALGRSVDAQTPSGQSKPIDPAAVRFFETHVRPVLANRCYECHSAKKQRGGLRVDSLAALLEGGDSGPALKPGQPEQSLLVRAIRHDDAALQMPPKQKLPAKEIADLTHWVKLGAPWPNAAPVVKAPAAVDAEPVFTAAQRNFWAFVPPKKPALPTVKDNGWVQSPIDAFILAKLEEKGMHPAAPADPRTLLRRMYFDLTGLPPTPAEVQEFVAAWDAPSTKRQAVIANVVDRLLASPQYGERWGRHWLDVARYADSNGMDENLVYGNAWRYRDYVIRAFNQDKPYDQFVREQIAGDVLFSRRSQNGAGPDAADLLIATGFLVIGPKMLAEDDPVKMEMDIIDEQIDTIGRTFLGLTLGCGRCHDHKYDPFPTADYYSLAGIFKSTKAMDNFKVVARWHERPVGAPHDVERKLAHDAKVKKLQAEIDRLDIDAKKAPSSAETPQKLTNLRAELAVLQKNAPPSPEAMAVVDRQGMNLRVHMRGNHLTLGKEAPRRFPRILAGDHQPPIGDQTSGRLELANWLTRPDHPLTSRVMVNRIWHWHFGAGLVRSPDNFGSLGERPTHPELLDWLAVRFVEAGWSIKALHREIMLSATYQQSVVRSQESGISGQTDPENRLWSRWSRRRLEVEAIRDALLFIGGTLDSTMGGSVFEAKNRAYVPGYPNAMYDKYDLPRRTVYLPVIRSALYDVFQVFDFADPSTANGQRDSTTVAPQALFMMNSKLVDSATRALAELLLKDAKLDDPQRLRLVYETTYARPPSPAETRRAQEFLSRIESELSGGAAEERRLRAWQSLCRVLVAANEFVYVD